MTLHRIPAVFYRGGTSKALIFHEKDLPADPDLRDAAIASAMGVPDPNGRNLDGMGGGLSSLNKACIVSSSTRADADVDYTFIQLSIDDPKLDYGGNCGNMSSAIGPFALEEGLVAPPEGSEAAVRIHNTNTGKLIVARFPVEDGLLAPDGEFTLDGVAGTAAPIRLEFLEPGGAKTGALLPTGSAVDVIEGIEASLIDAANPCVFVRAADLGKTGNETPQALDADADWLATMEAIRLAGATAMGLPHVASIPKVAMVAAPSGDYDIAVRMISVGQPHRAVPITGAICLGVACRVPGSIPARLCASKGGPIRIGHASGTTQVDAVVEDGVAKLGAVYRTARRLMEGNVIWRDRQ
ncbi:MAG: PrpF domain-containing protein [Sphingomonadaceae bacterium]